MTKVEKNNINTAEYHYHSVTSNQNAFFQKTVHELMLLLEVDPNVYYVESFFKHSIKLVKKDDFNHKMAFFIRNQNIFKIEVSIDVFNKNKKNLIKMSKDIENENTYFDCVFKDSALDSSNPYSFIKIFGKNEHLLFLNNANFFHTERFFRQEFADQYNLQFIKNMDIRTDSVYLDFIKISKLKNIDYLLHMSASKAMFGFQLHEDDYFFLKGINASLFMTNNHLLEKPFIEVFSLSQELIMFDKNNRMTKESKDLFSLNFDH